MHAAAVAVSSLHVNVELPAEEVKENDAVVALVVAAGWLVIVTTGAGAAAACPGKATTDATAATRTTQAPPRRAAAAPGPRTLPLSLLVTLRPTPRGRRRQFPALARSGRRHRPSRPRTGAHRPSAVRCVDTISLRHRFD